MRSGRSTTGVSSVGSLAWGILAAAIGLDVLLTLTSSWRDFRWADEASHLLTSLGLSLVLVLLLYARPLREARGRIILLPLTAVCLGLGIGVAWEWAEWLYDRWSGPQNRIAGKTDTLSDLGWDALGALAAGILSLALSRHEDPARDGAA